VSRSDPIARIERHFPALDLDQHITKWAELEDGSPATPAGAENHGGQRVPNHSFGPA
jgi:hypothetical protein